MIDVFAILIGGLGRDEDGQRLNLAPKTSFLAGLFFAAHPVHTESVSKYNCLRFQFTLTEMVCFFFFLRSSKSFFVQRRTYSMTPTLRFTMVRMTGEWYKNMWKTKKMMLETDKNMSFCNEKLK